MPTNQGEAKRSAVKVSRPRIVRGLSGLNMRARLRIGRPSGAHVPDGRRVRSAILQGPIEALLDGGIGGVQRLLGRHLMVKRGVRGPEDLIPELLGIG